MNPKGRNEIKPYISLAKAVLNTYLQDRAVPTRSETLDLWCDMCNIDSEEFIRKCKNYQKEYEKKFVDIFTLV